jgi:hypothetical protein
MTLRKIILGAALAVAPMQASIIATANDPGMSLLQDFSTATPGLVANTQLGTSLSNFTGIAVTTTGNGLVYVNPSTTYDCTNNFAPDKSCVTNFTVDEGDNYANIYGSNLTFSLNTAVKQVAFWSYFDPTPGLNTTISVYDTSHSLIDSAVFGPLQPNSPNWYTITELSNIGSVTIAAGGNITTAVANYGLVLSHIETAATPEPGTVGMFGLGLGALGFFARRRKA